MIARIAKKRDWRAIDLMAQTGLRIASFAVKFDASRCPNAVCVKLAAAIIKGLDSNVRLCGEDSDGELNMVISSFDQNFILAAGSTDRVQLHRLLQAYGTYHH